MNRYSYAGNNPLSYIDPSGLQGGEPVTTGSDCGIVCDFFSNLASAIGDFVTGCGHSKPPNIKSRPNGDGFQVSGFTQPQANANGLYTMSTYTALYTGTATPSLADLSSLLTIVPSVIATNNGQQVPVHGFPRYGNFCGAGGTGIPMNSTDAACQAHDGCFGNLQLNADDYRAGRTTPSQIQGAGACNMQLCSSALDINRSPSTPFTQRAAGAAIILVFDLIGPQAAQCHQ